MATIARFLAGVQMRRRILTGALDRELVSPTFLAYVQWRERLKKRAASRERASALWFWNRWLRKDAPERRGGDLDFKGFEENLRSFERSAQIARETETIIPVEFLQTMIGILDGSIKRGRGRSLKSYSEKIRQRCAVEEFRSRRNRLKAKGLRNPSTIAMGEVAGEFHISRDTLESWVHPRKRRN